MNKKIPLIENMLVYEKHIFFCNNVRINGKKSCGDFNAHDVIQFAKSLIKSQNEDKNIRISTSGCLGKCEYGPVLVIYPDNLWFTYNSKDQVEDIINKVLD